jgi:hypothetical protein
MYACADYHSSQPATQSMEGVLSDGVASAARG